MQFDNQKTRNVADVAARIMAGESIEPQQLDEKLHPNQQVLDVHEPEKDELTAKDFEMLRKKKKMKEENEVCPKCAGKGCEHCGGKGYHEEVEEEQAEQIDEIKMADLPTRRIQGKSYGSSKDDTYGRQDLSDLKGPKTSELKKIEKEQKKKVKESNETTFSSMLEEYRESGLKSLTEWAKKKIVKEEPTQEEYEEELQTQKAKSEGKVKQPDLTKGDVMAVQQEDVEQIDELSKGTLASYAKSATVDARMSQRAAKDFERHELKSRKPEYKAGAKEWKDKYQERAWKRQAGVHKAIDRLAKEEVEQIDETPKVDQGLSAKQKVAARAERVKRYTTGSAVDMGNTSGGQFRGPGPSPYKDSNVTKSGERKGLVTKDAIRRTKERIKSRLNREEVELQERHMTDAEMAKREDIVKSMKKGMQGFKDRYGDRAKNVMYATATKQAMKD